MNRQTLYQMLAVVHVVLMVSSMIGGYAFVGTASASAQQQESLDDSEFDFSTDSAQPDTQQSLSDDSVQNGLGDSSVNAQIADSDPVNVPAYLTSHTIENFSERRTGDGRYNISGVLNADPVQPVVPFSYSVNAEILVFEETASGETLVAEDSQNINLKPGSAHPTKLELDYDNGTTEIISLNSTHPNTTAPQQMDVAYDDSSGQFYVINGNGEVVKDSSNNSITNASDFNVSGVRDSYSADFGFNLQLSKENQDYNYYIFITGQTDQLLTTDYTPGTNAEDVRSQASMNGDLTTGTPAATTTGVSSYFTVRTNERYTEESDVTFVTSYKSTLERENKNIYEEIGLPIRGDYREANFPPVGSIEGFAKATSTNNDYASVVPNSENRIRLTTSTQTVPQNEPQTLVIRYVSPGDGNVSVIPIDSDGVPIEAGRNSEKPLNELGYVLPEDPTTVPYAVGQNNKTNVAVIQLTKAEQEQLNRYGELFLSYEAEDTSDDFRLYCQSIITGAVDRDVDACGINASAVDNYSGGAITNMTIHPGDPASFTGRYANNNSSLIGVDPSLSLIDDPRGRVYFEVTVKNTGTRPIVNEPIDVFKNVDSSGDITTSEVSYNKQDSQTVSSFSSYPTTETFSLSDTFTGKDVTMTTDMNTGDGTIIITVDDGSETREFVYDGHRGEISERLDGMGPSSTWDVTVETEMITGQRSPEVNSLTIEGKTVGSASNFKQTVSLDPGETQTVRFPASGYDVPTTNLEADSRIVYLANFYDDTDSVDVQTDVDIEDPNDCDNDGIVNSEDSTPGCDNLQSPQAIIDGPKVLTRLLDGTDTYRSGTQTVESTTCPGESTVTCPAGSSWDLEQQNVGSVGGTQRYDTTETGVPLNLNLLGSGEYQGNLEPLNRAGIGDPYRNLPGDGSQYTHEGYSVVDATRTQEAVFSEADLIDRYGSLENARAAGWVLEEPNVGSETVGTEYKWFRFIESSGDIQQFNGENVDRIDPEYSQVTQQEYELEDYSVPLVKSRVVAVETKVQQNDPDNTEFDGEDDWTQVERVEYVVNRYEESEYRYANDSLDDSKVEYENFYSDPGGDWQLPEYEDPRCTLTANGCEYFRPLPEEPPYWVYEWSRLQEREFRLHEKPVVENQNAYSRTFYETEVSWSRSMSGTLNEYEGPEFSQRKIYGPAQGSFYGDRSVPSESATEIIDYQWYINGNPVDRTETTYTNTDTYDIPTDAALYATFTGLGAGTFDEYSYSNTYTLPENNVQYHPKELTLTTDFLYRNDGSFSIRIVNEQGQSQTIVRSGTSVTGNSTINLYDAGFRSYSESYTVYYNGTSGGEYLPTLLDKSTLVADANRGGDTLAINRDVSGSVTIGLKVTDDQGYTDRTRKEVDIRTCGPDCTPPPPTPYIIKRDSTPIADYVGGVASVRLEVGGMSSSDDFYVVELSPGDIASDSQNAVCSGDAEQLTANEIKNSYDSWAGLNESQVVSRDDPYCVRTTSTGNALSGGSNEVINVEESQDARSGSVKRVVWEGSRTSGTSDTISFNINPRNTDLITVGDNQFQLTLRNVATGEVEQRIPFEVFFCHALNDDPDTRSTPPADRLTRAEGGLMCPQLNSDFDLYDPSASETGPAYDGGDACPYNPARQEFLFTFDDGTGSCVSPGSDGGVSAVWDNFSLDRSNVDATKHMVYYNRYEAIVGANGDEWNDGYSNGTLKLGYSPLHQDSFEDTYLQAYYPLSEPPLDITDQAPIEDEPATVLIGWNAYQFEEDEYYRDISPGDSLVTSVPAWSLEQELTKDDIDDGSYPYDNYWFAADLSGQEHHAPIFHTETRIAVDGGIAIPGVLLGTFGREKQDLYRGDERKLPARGAEGAYGSKAYRMNGQSYFVPFKETSPWFSDYGDYNKPLEYPCEDNSCSEFHPRLTKDDTPLNGPGWNQDIANELTSSGEFTVSMYVKPGPNHNQITDRKALFAMHDWNGYPFGVLKDGEQTKVFTSFHSQKFFSVSFKDYNTYSFRFDGSKQGKTSFGHIQYDSHGFVDLPDRVLEGENKPLYPALTGSELNTGFNIKDKKRLLIQSMGHSSTINHVPPEMKSLRVNNGDVLEGTPDSGTGYRHFVVSVEQGQDVTYYVDGLPYRSQLLLEGGLDIPSLFSQDTTFGGFTPEGGKGGLMHLVGAEMQKQHVTNYLRDYYISDYRLYSKALTQSEVQEHAQIDQGTYDSYRVDMLSERSLDRLNFECNTSCNKENVVNTRLNNTAKSNMTIQIDGDLNGGAVTVRAYPIDDSGNRMSGGSEYLQVSYNETQNVEYPYFFDPDQGNSSVGVYPALNLTVDDNPYPTETECQNYKVTCVPDSTSSDWLPTYNNPLPPFVGNEILMALDNGTISERSAYELAQHYDENQYYVQDKRALWQDPLYYSGGENVTMELYNISSQADFVEEVGYTENITTSEANTLNEMNSSYHEWEIVVTIESRPHSQESPEIEQVRVSTNGNNGDIDDNCDSTVSRYC